VKKKEKSVVSRNEIVNWVRSQQVFLDGLGIAVTQISAIEFALAQKTDKFETHLVSSRVLGRSTLTAPRVRLGVMYASKGRSYLKNDRTELVVRELDDTDESWRVKLRMACRHLEVDPDSVDELSRNIRREKT
jgi:hypothetical protein